MMNKRHMIISLLLLVILFAIPAAQAAPDCGAGPGPGVDWSGCDMTGMDFTNADLSDMILVGTDFTGSTFNNTDMSGSNLTGAIMQNIVTGEVGVVGPINANNAQIEGLDLTNNDVVIFATFVDASGTPMLPPAPPATVTIQCPAGNWVIYNTGGTCNWVPTAVTMLGMSVEPSVALLPFTAVGVMALVSGLFIAGLRKRREVVAV
jgi:hypothetical protein